MDQCFFYYYYVFLLFHCDDMLPYMGKRTRKISQRITHEIFVLRLSIPV